MPKAVTYSKGSIIYFEGDTDERVFILQKGLVVITNQDIETHQPVTEQIKQGEFFGVKSAFAHVPREETATVLMDSVCIAMTVPEFEQLLSSNKQVTMKMLQVFSKQLRQIHKRTEDILNNKLEDRQLGMMSVAKAFYDDESWRSCCDVCTNLVKRYPNISTNEEFKQMFTTAHARAQRATASSDFDMTAEPAETNGALKVFQLPAFSRFAKTYEDGEVIITEFEPGDCFYLIQSGNVQLVKCVNGRKKNLDILKPGELFGEMAILDHSPRSATCVASGKVECLEFNKANFELLIIGNPQIALMLIKLFCKRIHDQKRRLKILVIQDIQARLADVFCMFDEMYPMANPKDRSRRFNLTVQDVAHWAGISTETAREEIDRFVGSRKLEIYDNFMIVADIVDMKRIVDTKSVVRS